MPRPRLRMRIVPDHVSSHLLLSYLTTCRQALADKENELSSVCLPEDRAAVAMMASYDAAGVRRQMR